MVPREPRSVYYSGQPRRLDMRLGVLGELNTSAYGFREYLVHEHPAQPAPDDNSDDCDCGTGFAHTGHPAISGWNMISGPGPGSGESGHWGIGAVVQPASPDTMRGGADYPAAVLATTLNSIAPIIPTDYRVPASPPRTHISTGISRTSLSARRSNLPRHRGV